MTDDQDQYECEAKQAIQNNIEQFGFHLTLLEADNYLPGYAYTIGLYQKYGHPELICFGLSNEVRGAILSHVYELIDNGETFTTNKPYSGFLEEYEIQFILVAKEHYSDYVGYGGLFYNSFNFPLMQIVWPDKQHKFPWDEGFNPDWKFRQPLLDRNTDFKFYEERNLGVFTTKQVIEGEPILYVCHDEDGDWQFHTGIEPDPDDARLVSLDEITKLDPTINEVFHIQYGWYAWRENKNADWEYKENRDE